MYTRRSVSPVMGYCKKFTTKNIPTIGKTFNCEHGKTLEIPPVSERSKTRRFSDQEAATMYKFKC